LQYLRAANRSEFKRMFRRIASRVKFKQAASPQDGYFAMSKRDKILRCRYAEVK